MKKYNKEDLKKSNAIAPIRCEKYTTGELIEYRCDSCFSVVEESDTHCTECGQDIDWLSDVNNHKDSVPIEEQIERFGKPISEMTKEELLLNIQSVSDKLTKSTGRISYRNINKAVSAALGGKLKGLSYEVDDDAVMN